MTTSTNPRPFPEWRSDSSDRAEDAAYAFGHDLIVHCRDEALATIPPDASLPTRVAVEKAVDAALHNVMDLLEGFWPLPSGSAHQLKYVLQVRIENDAGELVETQEIAPCRLDLPIGYWKWARDREFR
jgi:hypothetical protein